MSSGFVTIQRCLRHARITARITAQPPMWSRACLCNCVRLCSDRVQLPLARPLPPPAPHFIRTPLTSPPTPPPQAAKSSRTLSQAWCAMRPTASVVGTTRWRPSRSSSKAETSSGACRTNVAGGGGTTQHGSGAGEWWIAMRFSTSRSRIYQPSMGA